MNIIVGKDKKGKKAAYGTHSDAVQVDTNEGKKTLTEVLATLKGLIDAMSQALDNSGWVHASIEDLRAILQNLEGRLGELETTGSDLRGITSEHSEALQTLEDAVARIRSSYEALKELVDYNLLKVTNMINAVQGERDEIVADAQSRIDAARRELQSAIDEAKAMTEGIDQKYDQIAARVADNEESLALVSTKVDEARAVTTLLATVGANGAVTWNTATLDEAIHQTLANHTGEGSSTALITAIAKAFDSSIDLDTLVDQVSSSLHIESYIDENALRTALADIVSAISDDEGNLISSASILLKANDNESKIAQLAEWNDQGKATSYKAGLITGSSINGAVASLFAEAEGVSADTSNEKYFLVNEKGSTQAAPTFNIVSGQSVKVGEYYSVTELVSILGTTREALNAAPSSFVVGGANQERYTFIVATSTEGKVGKKIAAVNSKAGVITEATLDSAMAALVTSMKLVDEGKLSEMTSSFVSQTTMNNAIATATAGMVTETNLGEKVAEAGFVAETSLNDSVASIISGMSLVTEDRLSQLTASFVAETTMNSAIATAKEEAIATARAGMLVEADLNGYVKKSGVIASINSSGESDVTISADRINLDGLVSRINLETLIANSWEKDSGNNDILKLTSVLNLTGEGMVISTADGSMNLSDRAVSFIGSGNAVSELNCRRLFLGVHSATTPYLSLDALGQLVGSTGKIDDNGEYQLAMNGSAFIGGKLVVGSIEGAQLGIIASGNLSLKAGSNAEAKLLGNAVTIGDSGTSTTTVNGTNIYIKPTTGFEINMTAAETFYGLKLAPGSTSMLNANGRLNVAASDELLLKGHGITISSTGTFDGNVPYIGSSDERLKDIVRELSPRIEDIAGVRIVDYRMKDGQRVDVGTIAQDWQALLPNAVKENPDGYLGLNYGGAALVSAVAAAREIVALKQENEALKARLAAIEARLGTE